MTRIYLLLVPVQGAKKRSQQEIELSSAERNYEGPVGRLQISHVAQTKPRGERSSIAQPSTVEQPPYHITTCADLTLKWTYKGGLPD